MDARDRNQTDREQQQDERARQQEERGREQRERAEQQGERERSHDQREHLLDEREYLRDLFVSVLGHDLRTPLSTIRLTATTLLEGRTLSVADASAVARIQRAASRMETMALGLLGLAKARLGGGFQVQRGTVDVVPLITELLGEFRVLYPDRSVTCELPATAEGSFDRTRIAQVISNLLRNAFENAPAGSPISIALVEQQDGISVEGGNEGPAIPAAVQETVFDPFRRGRQASTHGLGLGLFVAKEIATAHGGGLSFTSRDGETRFTLRLPRT